MMKDEKKRFSTRGLYNCKHTHTLTLKFKIKNHIDSLITAIIMIIIIMIINTIHDDHDDDDDDDCLLIFYQFGFGFEC